MEIVSCFVLEVLVILSSDIAIVCGGIGFTKGGLT